MKKSVKATLKILKTRVDYWNWGKKIIEGIYQKDKEKKIENLKSTLLKFKDSTNIYQKAAYQKNKERIEKLLKGSSVQVQNNKKNNDFPTGWVISGGIILAIIIGLMTLFAIKINRSKNKK